MPQFLLVPTAELSRQTIADVTVEAEYGSHVMEGKRYTAAHHQASGPYAGRHLPGLAQVGRPSPCNDAQIPLLPADGVVALSHIDLDAIGGALRTDPDAVALFSEDTARFWALAEQVDVRGPHRLDTTHPDVPLLYAVWAWLRSNHPALSRDAVSDCSAFIASASGMLRSVLLESDAVLLEAGEALRRTEEALNRASFRGWIGAGERRVLLRVDARFVNHLYRSPEGENGDAVVAHDPAQGSITVSLADAVVGVSCRELVQSLWGPEAGGHANIAGSPRGQAMSLQDVMDALSAVTTALAAA